VVAALVFAGFHMSVDRFVPQAVAGVVFGWLTVRTRSVVPAMVAHAAHNGLVVALGG
jgi:membrane protease YdiL (CAAX protease family)